LVTPWTTPRAFVLLLTTWSVIVLSRRKLKQCDLPPQGWHCNLAAGHDGPCPTYPDASMAVTPHCDPSILHAPRECEYCDMYPGWQEYRMLASIAFTGQDANDGLSPCPSSWFRAPWLRDRWYGNAPVIREEP
jgi:hypothetical protein